MMVIYKGEVCIAHFKATFCTEKERKNTCTFLYSRYICSCVLKDNPVFYNSFFFIFRNTYVFFFSTRHLLLVDIDWRIRVFHYDSGQCVHNIIGNVERTRLIQFQLQWVPTRKKKKLEYCRNVCSISPYCNSCITNSGHELIRNELTNTNFVYSYRLFENYIP